MVNVNRTNFVPFIIIYQFPPKLETLNGSPSNPLKKGQHTFELWFRTQKLITKIAGVYFNPGVSPIDSRRLPPKKKKLLFFSFHSTSLHTLAEACDRENILLLSRCAYFFSFCSSYFKSNKAVRIGDIETWQLLWLFWLFVVYANKSWCWLFLEQWFMVVKHISWKNKLKLLLFYQNWHFQRWKKKKKYNIFIAKFFTA